MDRVVAFLNNRYLVAILVLLFLIGTFRSFARR